MQASLATRQVRSCTLAHAHALAHAKPLKRELAYEFRFIALFRGLEALNAAASQKTVADPSHITFLSAHGQNKP
jgi:hypothetical protein